MASANTVNYYGVDHEIGEKTKVLVNTATVMEFETGYLVPIGYDGITLAFYNYYNKMIIDYSNPDIILTLGNFIDRDSLYFRLK